MRRRGGPLGRAPPERGVPKRPVISKKEPRTKTPDSIEAEIKRPPVPVKSGRRRPTLVSVSPLPVQKTIYFCHFPKTGGTFTTNVFKRLNLQQTYRFVSLNHGDDYSKYKGPNSILIANVRNPSEVVQSLYSHERDGFLNVIKKHSLKSFDDFWQRFTTFRIPEYHRIFCTGMLYRHVLDSSGRPYFDYVLRNETLEQDLRRVFDDLGIEYTDESFDLTSREANLFLHAGLETDPGYNKKHKYERRNKELIDAKKEQTLRELFGRYYQAFGY